MVELVFLIVGVTLVGVGLLGLRNSAGLVDLPPSSEWAVLRERTLRRGAWACVGVGVLFAVFSGLVLFS